MMPAMSVYQARSKQPTGHCQDACFVGQENMHRRLHQLSVSAVVLATTLSLVPQLVWRVRLGVPTVLLVLLMCPHVYRV
jgi:hypothetical protein